MNNCIVIKGANFQGCAVAQVELNLDGIRIGGIVSPSGAGAITGTGRYSESEVVTLEAIPNRGYKFERWSDGVTTATRNVTVGDVSAVYTAIFSEDVYQLFGLTLKENATDGKYSVSTFNTAVTDADLNILGLIKVQDVPNRLSTIPSVSKNENIFRGKTTLSISPKTGYRIAVSWGNSSYSRCNNDNNPVINGYTYVTTNVIINLLDTRIENIAVLIAPVEASNVLISTDPREYLTIELS